MAINSIGQDLAVYGEVPVDNTVEDRTSLTSDDFMMLLLAELQNQDPTEPTDTGTILTQTSELATLSATDDTNIALSELSASLSAQDQFSTISAIGKMADTGSDAIEHDKGSASQFEIYFPDEITSGTIDISDLDGNVVATIPIEMPVDAEGVAAEQLDAGVYLYEWDGSGLDGEYVDGGIYRVESNYTNASGEDKTTRLGAYPIESIRFEEGKAYAKLGSSYVPMDSISEIY